MVEVDLLAPEPFGLAPLAIELEQHCVNRGLCLVTASSVADHCPNHCAHRAYAGPYEGRYLWTHSPDAASGFRMPTCSWPNRDHPGRVEREMVSAALNVQLDGWYGDSNGSVPGIKP